jgi:hypothetical protein
MLSIPELRKVLELKVWIVQSKALHEASLMNPAMGKLFSMARNMGAGAMLDDASKQITAHYEHLQWIITLLERELGFEVTPENIEILASREAHMVKTRKGRLTVPRPTD